MSEVLCMIGGLLAGGLIGFWATWAYYGRRYVGTLREDRSDPTEAPFLFLELETDGVSKIHKNKSVVLKVKIEDYIPRG